MFETLKEKNPRWLFMSVVGSRNYGTATPESDTDVKVAYLPTFNEFYSGKFKHVDSSGPDQDLDFTVHPVHEFLRHAFKGNMNFWEVFFSDSIELNFGLDVLNDEFLMNARNAVSLNYTANFNAMRGMSYQKWKGITKHVNDPARWWKDAQHTVRMLDTILLYGETSDLYLDVNSVDDTEWFDWKGRDILTSDDIAYVVQLVAEKIQKVDSFEEAFENVHFEKSFARRVHMANCESLVKRLIKKEMSQEFMSR